MTAQAHNFRYRQIRWWNDEVKPEDPRDENAIYHAERMGARPIIQPVYADCWRARPDDEPGALYEWPDGSLYVIGLSGSWIKPAYHRGAGKRQTWSLTPETVED